MKEIIDFIETNVDGKTLFTKELVYELENGALQGVYADQICFSNLKYAQSGCQLDMFIVSNEKIWIIGKDGQREKVSRISVAYPCFALNWRSEKARTPLQVVFVLFQLPEKMWRQRLLLVGFMMCASKTVC